MKRAGVCPRFAACEACGGCASGSQRVKRAGVCQRIAACVQGLVGVAGGAGWFVPIDHWPDMMGPGPSCPAFTSVSRHTWRTLRCSAYAFGAPLALVIAMRWARCVVGVGACHAICACMRCRSKLDRCDSGDRVRRCSGRCVSRHKHASCLVERWAREAELAGARATGQLEGGGAVGARSRAAWWSGGGAKQSWQAKGGVWESVTRRDGTRIALIGSGDLATGTRGARDLRSVGCNDARGTGEGARECDAEGGHDGPGPIMSAV